MKLLLYCTKSKPYLYRPYEWDCYRYDEASRFYLGNEPLVEIDEKYNGKIVAECDYEVSEIKGYMCYSYPTYAYTTKRKNPFQYFSDSDLLKASCLNGNEITRYLGTGKNGDIVGYAIHIKNLNIFDEPRELSHYWQTNCREFFWGITHGIKKAPQNMMYAHEFIIESGSCIVGNRKSVLISIRPEWLCKILNGEKTIEIRKKVLKEMLKNE